MLHNSNLVDRFLELGKRVRFKLIVLLRVVVLLMLFLKSVGRIIIEPDLNLWDPEAAVAANLL